MMSPASGASAKPSAGPSKSPTTSSTWKNPPQPSARLRARTSPSRKLLIPRSTDCSAPTRSLTTSPPKPSRNSRPTATPPVACAPSQSTSCSVALSRCSLHMRTKSTPKRLDALVVERGLADSLPKAKAMILAGEVSVDGARADKAGSRFPQEARIEVTSRAGKYVSRGGLKLEGALQDFAIDPANRICLDIGSSTGGFTDCLLQRGAAHVYAVDVNVDQLAWKLRQDPRVIRISRNARNLRPADIPEPIDLVAIDVSFISVTKVLPTAAAAA